MSSSHMGVAITPANVASGALKDSFDPITHPQTRGSQVTNVTGSAKAGVLGGLAGPAITSAVKATTGGTLTPGTRVYKITAKGRQGGGPLGAGNTVVIAAAIAAPVQGAATVTPADSGIFSGTGTYYYKVTATNAIGETVGSNEISAVVAATTDSVTVNWSVVTDATGYKIYRGTSAGAEDHLVGTVGSGATSSFKDVGNTGTANTPPVSNGTSTNTNTVTLGWAAASGETHGYAVYRDDLHLADIAHGDPRSYVDDGSVTPAGAFVLGQDVAAGMQEGDEAPKPVDGGEQ